MANERMKNIAGLFKDTRTRTILLTTLFILLVAVVIGVLSMRGRVKGVEAGAGVTSAPGGIQSVPFSAPNEEYARLQEKQNKESAQKATEVGGSAIPTIVRATDNKEPVAVVSDTGLGFQGLSREQSDAGTFNAKEFGTGAKNCPISSSSSPLGTPVYDKNGRLIGYAGADGKVRDINGKVIGSVGPDGTARDVNGNVIGQTSRIAAGTPIYDSKNCSMIGRVGEDGQVRDASGKVPGILGTDGVLRDADGKTLGQAGNPAYTAEGRLIGFSCTDGKVRDENGNIIGSVGPDGVVRDLNGNIVGRVGAISPGTEIYGPDGKVIGTVGPDGKVRDVNGNIIGAMGVDGVVRDANGNILGSVAKPDLEKAVYGADGKIIGYVGADGKVRDVSGNIVGTVGADGKVRDAAGNIIGRVGSIASGTPIYGPDGKIIGYVGPDGKVRDANGNIIGTVGPDGLVRDANGNVIGSAQNPQSGNATGRSRIAIGSDQPVSQQVAQAQQSMASQANQLLAAWAPPSQQMVKGEVPQVENADGGATANGSTASGGNSGPAANTSPPFIKAGTVFYGVIETAVNSDEPGPVMATIISGPYKGGRLLGSLTYQKDAVMLSFNALSLKNFPKSIPVNVVAIDQNTARTGLSTETDHHYLYRYGSVFASAFIQGYGQAFQTSGSTISSNGLSTQTSTPQLNPTDKFFIALGNVGQQFSTSAQTAFNTPPTVYVASGTAVGLLFLADAQLPN
ncbi:MAG: TrbI/VirB10 family protein [Gammaproteobacteria bacterium]|nr:TrbI/VirB10 family protein [Gammaproteobacteria bacterium]